MGINLLKRTVILLPKQEPASVTQVSFTQDVIYQSDLQYALLDDKQNELGIGKLSENDVPVNVIKKLK